MVVNVIHPSTSVRNLGIIFHSTLSFDAHISSISKSANFHLRRIGHIRKYCSMRITQLLINALVLSRIYYFGLLLSDLKYIEVKKIDRIIRDSIRLYNILFIYNINRREYLKTDEHQHHLKWLLFRKRCKLMLLCLAHKSIFLGKSGYLHNKLKFRCILKQIRTSDAIILESNTLFSRFSNRQLFSVVPRILNVLPYDLREVLSLYYFRNKLKHYLNTS